MKRIIVVWCALVPTVVVLVNQQVGADDHTVATVGHFAPNVVIEPPRPSDDPLLVVDLIAAWEAQDRIAAEERWYAWELSEWLRVERENAEREAWLAAERENAAKAAARARVYVPPSSGWVHAWITDAVLYELRMCESTNNYGIDTRNGFKGAVQWLQPTWNAAAARAERFDLVGVPPNLVAPADQDYVTKVWWSVSDYRGQWPVCGPRAVARAG